jgi:acetylglutamate kinase|tara:strand:- start:1836 stop:2684 length:849 start_codon:yes stop_codon:yes gene_type:complete
MKLENLLPADGPSITEVNKYINKYKNNLIVVKCGGSCLLDKDLFDQLIEDISIINKLGLKVIVIHGGGKNIKRKLDEAKLETKFINGLRVTDEKTIKIVEESLIELNNEIISKLNAKNCEGVKFSTKTNNIILVSPVSEKLKYVGNPKEIYIDQVLQQVEMKKIPIIVPMGKDKENKCYNINADTAAGAIAKKINARRLLLMTDVEGVLDKDKKLISEINSEKANKMINDESISGGMIPKINTCIDAVNNGVAGVVIVDGRKPHSILFEIFSDKGSGTLIRK